MNPQNERNPAGGRGFEKAQFKAGELRNQCTALTLAGNNEKPRVDSRLMADYLGVARQHAREQLQRYKDDFKELGILQFQTGEINRRGQPEKFVLLNEDQAYLLLTFSRNTKRVRRLKVALVKAFANARSAAAQRQTQYLPAYHDLHDRVAGFGSTHLHMNINRLINKAVCVDAGQRHLLAVPEQSLIIVMQGLALQAMANAVDKRDAYTRAKAAIQTAQKALEGSP